MSGFNVCICNASNMVASTIYYKKCTLATLTYIFSISECPTKHSMTVYEDLIILVYSEHVIQISDNFRMYIVTLTLITLGYIIMSRDFSCCKIASVQW